MLPPKLLDILTTTPDCEGNQNNDVSNIDSDSGDDV